MHQVILSVEWLGLQITPWKMVGYCGVFLFGSRWLLQALASRKEGKPVVPIAFWYMSLGGSLLSLLYFVFGKNDSVGILGYLFPSAVAAYNLYLETARKKGDPKGTKVP